jgi:hypothetical protein
MADHNEQDVERVAKAMFDGAEKVLWPTWDDQPDWAKDVLYGYARAARADLDVMPEAVVGVGGVTREQVIETLDEFAEAAIGLDGGHWDSEGMADAILALFPPAQSVGTDGPVAAMLKVYGTPATTRDVGGAWVFDALRDDFEALATAWDEGYTACIDDKRYEPGYGRGNPYRAASATASEGEK